MTESVRTLQNRGLAHRRFVFLRPQPTEERLRSGSHVQQHSGIWLEDSGACTQRRNRRGRPLTNQVSAQVGIVARRRHDRNPRNPLRRVNDPGGSKFVRLERKDPRPVVNLAPAGCMHAKMQVPLALTKYSGSNRLGTNTGAHRRDASDRTSAIGCIIAWSARKMEIAPVYLKRD
jgi:hypothetical protein